MKVPLTIPSEYPTPWIVGPFGDVWVAADVEFCEGKWRETVPEPRIVVTLGLKDKAVGDLIVAAVNTYVGRAHDAEGRDLGTPAGACDKIPAEINAEAWHQCVETIMTIAGLSCALSPPESATEFQRWLSSVTSQPGNPNAS